jgi:hypothetical protein
MLTTTQWMGLLADGAISAAIFLSVAFVLHRYTRAILATVLIVAALVYVFFVQSVEGPFWLLIELTGVAIFGTMGVIGLRRSPWWLVAGWALHPLWDIALHFFGPGHTFAPTSYTIPCLSFDLIVAGVIALGIARGWQHFSSPPAGDADMKAELVAANRSA